MQVFQGHATVQLQGSTAKSTSLKGRSDWDFFVRLNDNLPTVTQAQRKAVHDQLQAQFASAGIHYRMQCGENRIRLFQGRDVQGPLPNCDVVFQRYKSDVRLPPNSKALASSHTAQQVSEPLAGNSRCMQPIVWMVQLRICHPPPTTNQHAM